MKTTFVPTCSFETRIQLSEQEARALVAITAYGTDSFLKLFYEHLGTSVLSPHEEGLRQLFTSIETSLVPQVHTIDKAWKAITSLQAPQTEP